MLDMTREYFPQARITWAINAEGREVGKRDDAGFVSGPWNHMRNAA